MTEKPEKQRASFLDTAHEFVARLLELVDHRPAAKDFRRNDKAGRHRFAVSGQLGEVETLVAQKDQVTAEGAALVEGADHPLRVVDDPVEGAVGEKEHLHPVELARSPQVQQLALDLRQRHAAVEGVRGERERIQVDGLRPGEGDAVVPTGG